MKKYLNIIIFFAIFVVFSILMMPSTQVLNASVFNIVDLEFLWNYENYQELLSTWSINEIEAARVNTLLDFGWLIGYGGLAYSLNKALARKQKGSRKKLLQWASYAAVIAVVCDMLENAMLLNLLSQSALVFKGLPLFVSLIASLKFAFIGFSVIIFIIMVVILIIKKYNCKTA